MSPRYLIAAALLLFTTPAPADAPNDSSRYRNVERPMGYIPYETFSVPDGLKPAVDFWRKIYSQYTTGQMVLHDSKHLGVVYAVLDFRYLNEQAGESSDAEMERLRDRQTEEAKRQIRETLLRLGQGEIRFHELSYYDRHIYEMFRDVEGGPEKFRAAADRIRAQLGQRDEFIRGIVESGAYLDRMEEIYRGEGLPVELIRLVFVESMFNPKAFSRVGASGLWQFMRGTGTHFLRISLEIDERNDPFLATAASANLLKGNYMALESWPLAVTAYNHGRSGMLRAVRRVGSRDLAEIIRNYDYDTFGFASRNFYAEFLAALAVEREQDKHFGLLEKKPPLRYDEVVVPDYVSLQTLAEYTGLSGEEIIDLNPSMTDEAISSRHFIPRGFRLKLPAGRQESFLAAYAGIPAEHRYDLQRRSRWHRVARGDTLTDIAARYGAPVEQLIRANRLRSRHRIYAGQVLRIPGRSDSGAVASLSRRGVAGGKDLKLLSLMGAGVEPAPEKKAAPLPAEELRQMWERYDREHLTAQAGPESAIADGTGDWIAVLPGETVDRFAEWTGISAFEFRRINRLTFRDPVAPGQRVKVTFDQVPRDQFYALRLFFHRDQCREFMSKNPVQGTIEHVLAAGSVADQCGRISSAPLWMVQMFNAGVPLDQARPGDRLVIPILTP